MTTLHHKRLKTNRKAQPRYFILLPDQTCIVGREFEVMKHWRRHYRNKPIVEMLPTKKRINSGITSLSKLIDYVPEEVDKDHKDYAW